MNDELCAKLRKSREAENQRKRRVAKKRAAKSPSPNSEVKKQKIRNEKIEESKLKKAETQRSRRAAEKAAREEAAFVETVLVDSDFEDDAKCSDGTSDNLTKCNSGLWDSDSDCGLFVKSKDRKLRKAETQRNRRAAKKFSKNKLLWLRLFWLILILRMNPKMIQMMTCLLEGRRGN